VQAANGVAEFIAPLAGVGLLVAVGLRGILSFDVASYAVAVSTTFLVRFPAAMPLQRAETVLAEIVAGFRYILAHRGFRAFVVFAAAINVFLAPVFVLMPPLVLSFTSLPKVAIVSGAAGVGLVAAGLTMAAWGGPPRRRMLGIRIALAALAVFSVLVGIRPNLPLVAVGIFGVSFFLGVMEGISMTIVQAKLPQRLQGRMVAVITMIALITVPLAYGVVAPFTPPLLDSLAAAHGITGAIIHAVVGTGRQRGIGLLYVCCGFALALLSLGTGRVGALARFDADVPDALSDDLLGIEVLGHHREPEREPELVHG
jgi:hypothetical protein